MRIQRLYSVICLLCTFCLLLCACSFPGASTPAAAPTPEAGAASTPELTPVPTPELPLEPIPALTPEPTSDPVRYIRIADSEAIRITRQPVGEELNSGSSALFTACADNAVSIEWRFVSPAYDREIVWNTDELREAFPGFRCADGTTETLQVENVPVELNGWYAVALFTDAEGKMLASEGAKITVTKAVYTVPAPTGTPAFAPIPTPTPIPASAPTGSPIQDPTPTSAPAPTQPPAPVVMPTPAASSTPALTPAPTPSPDPTVVDPSAHIHSYVSTVVAPTCEAGGYTLHRCSCGDAYKSNETAALGHNWEAHEETVPIGQESHALCTCGLDLTAAGYTEAQITAHINEHVLNGTRGSIYITAVPIFSTVTTYTCTRCGATK